MRSLTHVAAARLIALGVIAAFTAGGCARGSSSPALQQSTVKPQPGWADRNQGSYGLGGNGVDRGPLRSGAGAAFGGAPNSSTDTVYFQPDSSALTPEGQATLAVQLAWLRNNPTRGLTIEGHADERGTREYNIALGARRAEAVRNYFASQGMNPGLVRTVSYGKERPIATCDDISCWSKNRRAQVVLSQ